MSTCACQVLEALKRDGLVSKHVPKATAAEGEEAVTGANQSAYTSEQVVCYWGINFETLADTVTYKLDAMQRNISEGSGSELQSFVCPSCGTRPLPRTAVGKGRRARTAPRARRRGGA